MKSCSPDRQDHPASPAGAMLSSEVTEFGELADISREIRLHIGGVQPRAGWKILNIQPGPYVDFVGSCTDLTGFADGSIAEVYASHVFEHLGYQAELPQVLAGIRRVLRPGGRLRISVPDLDVLCRMFVHPALTPEARFHVMRIIYGGQMDAHDFHKVGFTLEFLTYFLAKHGFCEVRRVASHDLFDDTSRLVLFGQPISLNVVASI
ncbi:class I SAM-dependent methyltransferase [Geminicoccus flavidas]|uniref:class I SAM-dependent methyltransferase n=1 Tax=Geminicoccus flavidas TaxID=2506407 RepID=UPI00135C70D3|nr:methyltransferase domain-containing protein [Geminicoccus flavidas]